jgi:dTDP-4-amino-4,6-dideoxygalactose transaminase
MDASRTYTNFGPLVNEFQDRLAVLLGLEDSRRVVLASSATVALEGVCSLLGVQEFAVPAYTFPATAHAVIRASKKIKILDINASDWQINDDARIDPTTGIVRVLPFGAAPDLKRDVGAPAVVIDAAGSLGAHQLKLDSMPENHVVVFSLHATKIFGIGEGGIAVFGTTALADEFRTWLNFGFSGNRVSQRVATNGKLSEVGAAYGLAVLDSLETEYQEWFQANAKARTISETLGITSIVSHYTGVSPYWIATFDNSETANRVADHLSVVGIETRRWWESGINQMPAFSQYARGSYAVTEEVASSNLGLPMFRDISDAQFDRISQALSEILHR